MNPIFERTCSQNLNIAEKEAVHEIEHKCSAFGLRSSLNLECINRPCRLIDGFLENQHHHQCWKLWHGTNICIEFLKIANKLVSSTNTRRNSNTSGRVTWLEDNPLAYTTFQKGVIDLSREVTRTLWFYHWDRNYLYVIVWPGQWPH